MTKIKLVNKFDAKREKTIIGKRKNNNWLNKRIIINKILVNIKKKIIK